MFQILKRHFSRYTPEMVERICGISRDDFLAVADALVENSGRERTSAFCYALGWTQHTVGVQMIRTAAILQLLLGNIGRPGGGILALRGHASIQGSTDIPTLYDLLPGYLPMPTARERHLDLQTYVDTEGSDRGWWSFMGDYAVSFLKTGSVMPRPRRTTSGSPRCRASPGTTPISQRCCALWTAAWRASS